MHCPLQEIIITLFKAMTMFRGTDTILQNIFTFRLNVRNIPHNIVQFDRIFLTFKLNVKNILHNNVSPTKHCLWCNLMKHMQHVLLWFKGSDYSTLFYLSVFYWSTRLPMLININYNNLFWNMFSSMLIHS